MVTIRVKAVLPALVSAALLGGCAAGDPPTFNSFLGMSQTQRATAWAKMTDGERKVLNCKITAFVSFVEARGGFDGAWTGTIAEGRSAQLGTSPGVEACGAYPPRAPAAGS